MKKVIISVLGKDQPGIIAAVTDVLFTHDFNIENVSQTILQAEFSGIFIVSGPKAIPHDHLIAALCAGTTRFCLHFHVKDLAPLPEDLLDCRCEPFVITTRGPDRKGLVASITAVLAAHDVNVTNLQAVFKGGNDPERNIMIYEVDIPLSADQEKIRRSLQDKARELDLVISIQHKKIFEAINRI